MWQVLGQELPRSVLCGAILGAGALRWPLLLACVLGSVAVGLAMYFGIAGAFELLYYRRRRDRAEEWKIQPRRFARPQLRRSEILLGTFNMTVGSIGSGLFAYHVMTGGRSSLYFDRTTHGIAFSIMSTVSYFLATDCGLYWAHRLYHRKELFKAIHVVHHRNTTPTAFTAPAAHPVEFLTYQFVMFVPVLFWPLPAAGLIAVLVFQNYVSMVDHSGVRLYPWAPWQPPAQFHDDHHAHFHVNYGQNLSVWDWLFGTYRRQGRRYGVEVFGGKGAPDSDAVPAPLVRYKRVALEAAFQSRAPVTPHEVAE
jgi:lathosterol oxidase